MMRKFSRTLCGVSLTIFFAWAFSGTGRAYVMPAEQLIGFLSSNFSKFKTVVLTQETRAASLSGLEGERSFEEKLWLKPPRFFRSETIAPRGGEAAGPSDLAAAGAERAERDVSYRRLLMVGGEKELSAFLREKGVRLDAVSLTRLGGRIAYCIGGRAPSDPKLLIEKETFLPILFAYRQRTRTGEEQVKVEFRDYREVDGGKYPYEIVSTYGEGRLERSVVLDLQINGPINLSR